MNSWSGEVDLDLGSEFHGINTKQANFIELITQKALYIDKTALLEFLDYSCYSCHCLNRPKGCGKTTTIGMIKAFYDISLKDAYDYLFKDLYIYQKKLAHNCYTILEFDFGEISSIDDIAEPIFYALDNFAAKYNLDYQVNRSLPISRNIDLFINNYQRSYNKEPIYVLIDNYNDFIISYLANQDITTTPNLAIDTSQLLSFYKALFRAKNQGVIVKIFATGILSDYLIEGLNDYFKDITFIQSCATAVGFTENDVAKILRSHHYLPKNTSYNQFLDNTITYFDGYSFSISSSSPTIINAREFFKYLNSAIGKFSPTLATKNHHTLYLNLKKVFTFYPKLLQAINDDLTKANSVSAYTYNKNCNLYEKSAMVWYLFYLGVLTIKNATLLKDEQQPIINFRITNNSVGELWKNIISE